MTKQEKKNAICNLSLSYAHIAHRVSALLHCSVLEMRGEVRIVIAMIEEYGRQARELQEALSTAKRSKR